MKKIMQTPGAGNCFQACIASILELELNDVPHFCNGVNKQEFNANLLRWLLERNLYPVVFEGDWDYANFLHGYYIARCKVADDMSHSVICRNGKLIHDPHPNSKGLLPVQEVLILVPTFGN